MRRWIATAALVGFVAAVALDAAEGRANTDPPSALEKKAEAAARKRASAISRGAVSQIRNAAVQASKAINAFTKALKTGRNIDQLSGVPSLPGTKVTDEQRLASFGKVFETVGQFHGQALSVIQDAYEEAATDSTLLAFGNTGLATRLPGSNGPADTFTFTLHDGWRTNTAVVNRSLVKLQSTVANTGGANFTYVAFDPPDFTIPVWDGSVTVPVSASQIIATSAVSDGSFRTLLAAPPSKQVAGQDTRAAGVSLAFGSETAAMPQVEAYNDIVFYNQLDASIVDPQHTYAYGRNGAGLAVTPCSQVSVPDPCVPPERQELRDVILLFRQVDGTNDRTLSQDFDFRQLPIGGSAFNSNRNIQINNTTPNVDQQYRASGALRDIGPIGKLAQLDAGAFPCGMGPNGLTVCAEIPAADPGGRELVIAVTYGATIALAHPSDSYQFGFVFDGDGNASNNYVASAQFAGDYYQGTDTWYSLEYTPGNGWKLKVTDARNGGFVAKASAARAVISGRTIALVVPASEFAVARPAFRTTSFRHTGDFGQNPPYDYNADYDPEPGKALAPFPDK